MGRTVKFDLNEFDLNKFDLNKFDFNKFDLDKFASNFRTYQPDKMEPLEWNFRTCRSRTYQLI